MNCEQIKDYLATAIENRYAERATNQQKQVLFPTLFALLWTDEGLLVKWSQNLSDKERKASLGMVTVRKNGYSAEEWDALTRAYFKTLNKLLGGV